MVTNLDIFDPVVKENTKGKLTIDNSPADIAWMFGCSFRSYNILAVSDYRLRLLQENKKNYYLFMLYLHEVGHMLLGDSDKLEWHKGSLGYTPLLGSKEPAIDQLGKHCVSTECIMYPIIDFDSKSAETTGSFIRFENDSKEYRNGTLVEIVGRLGSRKFCDKCFEKLRNLKG